MRLGKHEKRILKWLYDRQYWHYTAKIAEALVPDSYRHSPREWVSLKLRQLERKKFIRGRQLPGAGNIKTWKITDAGKAELIQRDIVKEDPSL